MATKPVVVGVDGSEESLLAAEWAAMEADRHGRPLRIVSAPATVPRMHGYQASPATEAGALHAVSARALGTAVTRAGDVAPGLAIGTGLLSGTRRRGRGGQRLGCGPAGRRGLRGGRVRGYGPRLGQPVRGYPRDVPRGRGPAGDHGGPSGGRRRHPRSGGRQRRPDVRVRGGGRAPRRSRGDPCLALDHVPPDSQAAPEGALQAPAQLEQAPTETAHRLSATLDIWCRKYPGVRVRYEIVRGHPGRVLADYSFHADLVVIGRHGKSGIGSILHPLLNHARGPVAIVPSVS